MKTNDGWLIFKIDEVLESDFKISLMSLGFVPGTIIHVKLKFILGMAICRVKGAEIAIRMDAYKTLWLKPTHY